MSETLTQAIADERGDVADYVPRSVVYFLADPRSPRAPRYVGSTSNPEWRANGHRVGSHKGNPALAAWKDELRADGVAPLLVVLAEFAERHEAHYAERVTICRMRRRGIPLFNIVPLEAA